MTMLRRWDVWLFLASVLTFVLWPRLDIAITSAFFDPTGGFVHRDDGWVQLSYVLFAKIHFVVSLALLWMLFASWHWRNHAERGLRRKLVFLILVLAVGPGILVNGVFKAEWGRARPKTVTEFGGELHYTPPGVISDQCPRNCSFVSGHASMGFFPLALAWVFGRRRWLWMGIGVGAAVGLGRMVQGAHFFSDVLFSGWVVYGTALLFSWWLFGRTRIEQERE